jgi:sarcosine oxidase subunit beta
MGRIYTPTASDFGKPDAVLIGGGIVGTATAFWLSRAGLGVVLVEMRRSVNFDDTGIGGMFSGPVY